MGVKDALQAVLSGLRGSVSEMPAGSFSTEFRKYVKYNQSVKIRHGYINNKRTGIRKTEKTFNVGLRFVIPGNPRAIRRAWVTFYDKASAKSFAEIARRKFLLCKTDAEYNATIHGLLDEIRGLNPDVPEEVAEGDGSDEA